MNEVPGPRIDWHLDNQKLMKTFYSTEIYALENVTGEVLFWKQWDYWIREKSQST